ncbi:PRC-barrel domain-containing protein [Halomonas sp.]|jgi:hypothetical protein|uniref:PRC-barrel domain-containing protein n=1 Tax=Halomonas sp. TaxID=1486246 RepID=UPI00356A835A
MRQTILALSLSLVAGSPLVVSQAQADIQGLYSANAILAAEVYLDTDPDEPMGSVRDVLLDDDKQVAGLVIRSGGAMGLGGRDIVINNDHFRLDALTAEDQWAVYRIIVDASADELDDLPEYDQAWWEQARKNAADAWSATQEDAESAWQRTRDAVNGN